MPTHHSLNAETVLIYLIISVTFINCYTLTNITKAIQETSFSSPFKKHALWLARMYISNVLWLFLSTYCFSSGIWEWTFCVYMSFEAYLPAWCKLCNTIDTTSVSVNKLKPSCSQLKCITTENHDLQLYEKCECMWLAQEKHVPPSQLCTLHMQTRAFKSTICE